MLTRLIVLIISQYLCILNHYIVHLKLICYMSIKSQLKRKERALLESGEGSSLLGILGLSNRLGADCYNEGWVMFFRMEGC